MFRPQRLTIFTELAIFFAPCMSAYFGRRFIHMIRITFKIKILKSLKLVYGQLQYKIILIGR
jgi:hypothetical protein